jgi:ABC-type multidrug transport system fused ATPase/permease subunit
MGALILYNPLDPATRDAVDTNVTAGVVNMCNVSAITLFCSFTHMVCWVTAGENQTKRIRELYFKAILRQEVGWFDKNDTGALTTQMTANISMIQDGLSDKVGLMIQFSAAFVAGFVVGFIKGWELALVLCSAFPLLSGAAFFLSKVLAGGSSNESAAYAEAGSVAQQVLSSMRTVSAFGGEDKEIARYNKCLNAAEKAGLKKALLGGVGVVS